MITLGLMLPPQANGQHDPPARESSCEKALTLLQEERFEEAYALVKNLVDSDDADTVDHLCFVAVSFEIEKKKQWRQRSRARLREVVEHCTAALKHDDTLSEARLIRGVVELWLEEWPSARTDLALAAAQLEPDRQETGAPDTARELQRLAERELQPWVGSLRLGMTFDSNVPLVGGNVASAAAFGRKEDYRFEGGITFLRRAFIDDQLEMGLGFGAAATWQSDLDLFDEQRYSGMAYVRHRPFDWLETRLDYHYEFDLLGRQQYLSQHRLTPSVSLLQDFRGRTTAYYEFESRRFDPVPAVPFTPDFDRSGDVHALGIFQRVALADSDLGQLSAVIGYRHENIATDGTEFDARNDILHAGLEVPVAEDFTFALSGRWAWEDYKERSILDRFDRGRSDFVQTYDLTLVYELDSDVSIHGFVAWTDDDSNVITSQREQVYSYDRWLFGIGVTINIPFGNEARYGQVN